VIELSTVYFYISQKNIFFCPQTVQGTTRLCSRGRVELGHPLTVVEVLGVVPEGLHAVSDVLNITGAVMNDLAVEPAMGHERTETRGPVLALHPHAQLHADDDADDEREAHAQKPRLPVQLRLKLRVHVMHLSSHLRHDALMPELHGLLELIDPSLHGTRHVADILVDLLRNHIALLVRELIELSDTSLHGVDLALNRLDEVLNLNDLSVDLTHKGLQIGCSGHSASKEIPRQLVFYTISLEIIHTFIVNI